VSAAVRFATANKIPLTARGGGHSTSGASSSDGGMVVDLARMRNVTVDAEARTVTYEGGCLFGDVDSRLAAHGLATVGGVYNETGVGGLVLADGSIVDASETQRADLFWAMRGAGAQFGIVTRFTSRAHPQGDIWGGPLVFTLDKLPQLVEFANEFHERGVPDHNYALVFTCVPPDYTVPMAVAGLFYNGPAAEAEKFFDPLLKLEPVANMTRVMPYPAANTLFSPWFEGPGRRLLGSGSVSMPLSADVVAEAGRRFVDFITSHNDMGKSALFFEFFPTAAINSVPHDATAFANRGEHYIVVMVFQYQDASYDGEVRAFKRELSQYVTANCGYHGSKGSDGHAALFYVNLEHESLSPEDAFGDHVGKLRELKQKYDPDNVFHKWHTVVPESKDTNRR